MPRQARASRTVDEILDAAAAVIDEVGYDATTTALIAQRASRSIGLVYRYFPDRIAVAVALVRRNAERFATALLLRLDEPHVRTWRDGLQTTLDVLLELNDREPGFAAVGFADEFLLRQGVVSEIDNSVLADGFLAIYRERYAVPGAGPTDEDLRRRLLVVVEISNALINRSVRSSPEDRAFLMGECARIGIDYLAEVLDP